MRQIRSLLFLFLFIPLANNAQNHPFLVRFQAAEVEGMVYLTWTLEAGNTCNGVSVLRSTEGGAFAEIGDIPGVCGSISEDVDYAFTDSFPKPNTLNSYRLELGNEGLSQIVSIQVIRISNNGYQIRPHPVIDQSHLYFRNENRELHILQLHDIWGSTILELRSNESSFVIQRSDLRSGLFLFSIRDNEGGIRATGKIVIGP